MLNHNDRLTDHSLAFANPGALRARAYLPEALAKGAPLVVALHGCTQSAAAYDHGSGWSRLADVAGFALLYPEQQRGNNPNLCFNWFARKDTARGQGEAASIAAMIGAMVAAHGLDPARVFITGLSAGGAMSASMLANYPELFAAGAIIAGLPAGVAEGVPEALSAMAGSDGRIDKAHGAGRDKRPTQRPRLSVWHGSADTTVVPANGEAIVAQALALHGLNPATGAVEAIGPHRRTVWRDPAKSAKAAPLVEHYHIAAMGHGVPLSARGAANSDRFALGVAGAHMLEAGIDSTARIADFFGIAELTTLGVAAQKTAAERTRPAQTKKARTAARPIPRHDRQPSTPHPRGPATAPTSGAQAVIEDALRKAGLM